MQPPSALLWRTLRLFQVWGSNTDVGKTIFTTTLCNAAVKKYKQERVSFLKPVSTGAPHEADSWHITQYAPNIENKTLFQYDIACSPHTAALASGQDIPSDSAVLAAIRNHASQTASFGPGWLFLETAGGVHSPGPSGTPQADLYSPLRAPAILVADAKLGGISQTISAYESLKMRGQDIEAILLFKDTRYENYRYLEDYFRPHNIPVVTMSPPPLKIESDEGVEKDSMTAYYDEASSSTSIHNLLSHLDTRHADRISRLKSLSQKAHDIIWYPFTQHTLLSPEQITTIDSASGDFFQVATSPAPYSSSTDPEPRSQGALLQPAFDGSASWWTQGLGHGSSKLTLAAAYASGRYGHVMFASAAHEPAVALAEELLTGLDNPRLSRVFYSDNGSTGCEVATKMALRASRNRYGWGPRDEVGILGLSGSYHGDTMGAMDCSEPGVFNEKVEWYRGRGWWLGYPTVSCEGGKWKVKSEDGGFGDGEEFGSLAEIFDLERRVESKAREVYETQILGELERLAKDGKKFGALMLEPVVLGAGGMIFVDPLFQRTLVDVVRGSGSHLFSGSEGTERPSSTTSTDGKDWSGLPVIFDEVFVGLYRLGRFSAASLLGVNPDISVHAKLLTGGLVPLCTTLASDSIFRTFESNDKSDALLHGHSYTAHAVGCQVALESLREMNSMNASGAWDWAKRSSPPEQPTSGALTISGTTPKIWSMWSDAFIRRVSRNTSRVEGAWALGSVLAITLREAGEGGYKSTAAADLQARLRRGRGEAWCAHTRVLGNVFYMMTGQKTDECTVRGLEELLVEALDA